jgi:hypothetical protein
VLVVYGYFGSAGTFEFRRVTWEQAQGRPGQGYYHSLAEGFRRGHLWIAHTPDPKLGAVPHPYDFHARHNAGVKSVWDASYFNGRYYLYFTPLPVLLFYLPWHTLTNGYPPDSLAGFFFAAWAFVMAAAFVRRAAGNRPLLPLWIVAIGLGNFIPFLLPEPKVYENAVFTGMAMSATWAYALLRFLQAPSRWRLFWVMVWLALAIAARPNLLVLLLVTAFAIYRALRSTPRTAAIALIPLLVIGGAMAAYNYARFLDPLEFGARYQLTFVAMEEHRVCGVCNTAEAIRVVNHASHYLFWAPTIGSSFPFVDLRPAALDPATTFPSGGEQIGGIAPVLPLALLGSLCALVLALRRDRAADAISLTAPLYVHTASWLILLGLSTCWWVTARYALDFMLLMSASAVVCIEAAEPRAWRVRIPLIILACWSIAIGVMLGFEGVVGSFERVNPELFRRLSSFFA